MKKQKGHLIKTVKPDSIAEEVGIEPGDRLLEINGETVEDIFDYQYMIEEEYVEVLIAKPSGEEWLLEIDKDYAEDLGVEFENGLMDDYRSCSNKCIFCFIDQMPKGMRETLYFKDDDSRLSFLQGNYVTLTNMSDQDVERVIKYHMSPINISFQTTNPELRCMMLHNRFAGDALKKVDRFYEAGIEMNGQIVLCKGINDGEELDRTMRDLKKLYPSVTSVSIVPVGLTKYREGLYPLESFENEDAARVLKQINDFGDDCLEEIGTRLFYPADEFFLQSGTPIPDCDYYENFEQIENGVGMTACFDRDFREVMASTFSDKTLKAKLTLVTGVLIFDFISAVCEDIRDKFPNVSITVYPITNKFFGEKKEQTITV